MSTRDRRRPGRLQPPDNVVALAAGASGAAAAAQTDFLQSISDLHRTGARHRGWLVRRALVAADVIGLVLAFGLAQLIAGTRGDGRVFERFDPGGEVLLFLATLPLWIVVARAYRLYDRDEERTDHSSTDDLIAVFHLITVGAWLLVALATVTAVANPSFVKVITFWALAIVLVTLARAVARSLCRRHASYVQNTVIVGAGDVGQLVARKLLQHPEYRLNLVGFVDSSPKERRDDLGELTLLGGPEDLPEIVSLLDVERVIVAFSGDSHSHTLELIRSLKDHWVQIDIVPRLFEIVSPSAGIHTVEGLPLVGLPPLRLSRTSRALKRMMDVAVAAAGLVVLAPFFLVAALLIKRDSPGPIFFRQQRVGSDSRIFSIYKLRTMDLGADGRKHELAHLNAHARKGGDSRMFKIERDPRVTRIGRLLRRYSLDELPQLINVLRGEMSLVGPRPLILEEDSHVGGWGRRRLDLKPGITGLWQVLGRSGIPFEEMVKLDYMYVTTWSLWSDVRIMFRTVPLVLRGELHGY